MRSLHAIQVSFHEYQAGRAGFGKVRVFRDEVFSRPGCGYDMDPHHNFIISAFVLQGKLTHVNTIGKVEELRAGDTTVFSAGAGGKHAELNIDSEDMHAFYLWVLPDHRLLYKGQGITRRLRGCYRLAEMTAKAVEAARRFDRTELYAFTGGCRQCGSIPPNTPPCGATLRCGADLRPTSGRATSPAVTAVFRR